MVAYLDVLRFVASIAVIVIHVMGKGPYVLTENIVANPQVFTTSVVIDSFARFCVPVFFMISGAVLFRKKELELDSFLVGRVRRVVIPAIFWGFAYNMIFNRDSSIFVNLRDAALGKTYYHLWFLYSIVGLYLITPILFRFIKNCTKKELEYFLIIGAIGNIVVPLISAKYWVDLGGVYNLNYFIGHVFYFVLGYYLMNYDLKVFNKSYKSIIIYLISTIIMAICTTAKSLEMNNYYTFFTSYTWVIVMVQSVAIFTFFKHINIKSTKVSSLSKMFMGIYILHPLVLDAYEKIWKIDYLTLSVGKYLVYAFMGFVVVYGITLSITYIIKQVPILKETL